MWPLFSHTQLPGPQSDALPTAHLARPLPSAQVGFPLSFYLWEASEAGPALWEIGSSPVQP